MSKNKNGKGGGMKEWEKIRYYSRRKGKG